MKIVGKRSLSFIPILGWSWALTESIFLRRVWERDQKILERDIQTLIDGYPENYFFSVRRETRNDLLEKSEGVSRF